MKKIILDTVHLRDLGWGPERVAYIFVAKWMDVNKDPLWLNIVGNRRFESVFDKYPIWVPAVAAKYLWGHLSQDKNPSLKYKLEDPKPILERYRMYFSFETPMAMPGYEGHVRLPKLTQLYYLAEAVGSPWISYTMDMEHMLGCNIDPVKDISDLPQNGGSRLKIVHVTLPVPLNPTHLPVPLGSEGQLYIYERLYDLRKKGFTWGWIIFERGGGQDPVQQTILSIRNIVKFLEKNTPPKELPLEFFGMNPEDWEVKTQEVKIREKFFEPLKGTLLVPEEEYTFLSSEALKKGKRPEEWAKERYR